ncbi:MAG: glycosyltransferase, partial [Cyanobacteria bacterium P01_D01_bin.56]
MKVLHLNTYDSGGAGSAVYRLHQGLIARDVLSKMLVSKKRINDDNIVSLCSSELLGRMRISGGFLPNKLYRSRKGVGFSSQWLPDNIASSVRAIQPDIIHLHWINHSFVQIETLSKLGFPLVWTLHDMWPFTGGCHYSSTCNLYTSSCGNCPILRSNQKSDLSSLTWTRKRK